MRQRVLGERITRAHPSLDCARGTLKFLCCDRKKEEKKTRDGSAKKAAKTCDEGLNGILNLGLQEGNEFGCDEGGYIVGGFLGEEVVGCGGDFEDCVGGGD
jgi:hypothetical protein